MLSSKRFLTFLFLMMLMSFFPGSLVFAEDVFAEEGPSFWERVNTGIKVALVLGIFFYATRKKKK